MDTKPLPKTASTTAARKLEETPSAQFADWSAQTSAAATTGWAVQTATLNTGAERYQAAAAGFLMQTHNVSAAQVKELRVDGAVFDTAAAASSLQQLQAEADPGVFAKMVVGLTDMAVQGLSVVGSMLPTAATAGIVQKYNQIEASLDRFQQTSAGAVVLQEGTGRISSGHQVRLELTNGTIYEASVDVLHPNESKMTAALLALGEVSNLAVLGVMTRPLAAAIATSLGVVSSDPALKQALSEISAHQVYSTAPTAIPLVGFLLDLRLLNRNMGKSQNAGVVARIEDSNAPAPVRPSALEALTELKSLLPTKGTAIPAPPA